MHLSDAELSIGSHLAQLGPPQKHPPHHQVLAFTQAMAHSHGKPKLPASANLVKVLSCCGPREDADKNKVSWFNFWATKSVLIL